MTKQDKVLVCIPFSGFYCSFHETIIDQEFERCFQDDHGMISNQAMALQEKAFDLMDWSKVNQRYAVKYVEIMEELANVPMDFESLSSPQFYNYATDRIFAEIALSDLQRMFDNVNKSTLTSVCKKMFTSYDGFISSYEPDYTTWPNALEEWDHNQTGALLRAYLEDSSENIDDDLIQACWDMSGNGDLYSILFDGASVELDKVLRKASEFRNLEQD